MQQTQQRAVQQHPQPVRQQQPQPQQKPQHQQQQRPQQQQPQPVVRQQQQHKQQPMMQREAPAPQRQQPLPPQQPPSLAPLAAGARQAQELPQHRRAQQPTSYAPPARDRPLYQPEREMPSEVPPAGERRMSASAQAALAAASSTVCSCASFISLVCAHCAVPRNFVQMTLASMMRPCIHVCARPTSRAHPSDTKVHRFPRRRRPRLPTRPTARASNCVRSRAWAFRSVHDTPHARSSASYCTQTVEHGSEARACVCSPHNLQALKLWTPRVFSNIRWCG
jgi:hypothetical protein